MKTKDDLRKVADALANERVLVATNQGTYGATEACQKVGCGSPEFADCNLYEVVGDPPQSDAALQAQHNGVGRLIIGRKTIDEKRTELAALRRKIASM